MEAYTIWLLLQMHLTGDLQNMFKHNVRTPSFLHCHSGVLGYLMTAFSSIPHDPVVAHPTTNHLTPRSSNLLWQFCCPSFNGLLLIQPSGQCSFPSLAFLSKSSTLTSGTWVERKIFSSGTTQGYHLLVPCSTMGLETDMQIVDLKQWVKNNHQPASQMVSQKT